MEQSEAQVTFSALKSAIESGDREALSNLYADNVELIGYSKNNMPSQPLRTVGKANIEAGLKAVFAREAERQKAGYPSPVFPWTGDASIVSQQVSDEVIGTNSFSYMLGCNYGANRQLVSMSTAYVNNGQIVREVTLEAWDE